MTIIKLLITILILAIGTLSVIGVFWWDNPPEKLAHYAAGGKAILGITTLGSAFALWQLWVRDRRVDHG